jgi:hypothetical protein
MTGTAAETDFPSRRWWLWVVALWLVFAGALLAYRWHAITWFALGDTDDNMRMMQVRALLHGQGWFDLRQYRMDPPGGANIHWSRIVDLPIAGIILALRPFVGGAHAEMAAVALAPLVALLAAMAALGVAVRRLISPGAYVLAYAVLACAATTLLMFMPLRIDHHGWQLAMLAWSVAGLADPRPVRGGVTVGISSAVSLAIGLELIPYVAMAGAAIGLRWVWDRADRTRLLGYAAFASYDNAVPRCDALTPVWLSVAVLGGGLLVLLSLLPIRARAIRLAAAAAAGLAVAVFYALAWPQCLGMLEGISPELKRLWFDNVKEARPLYRQSWTIALPVIALPLSGLAGAGLGLWRNRATPIAAAWGVTLLFSIFALAMLLWQTRAGPAAQLLAVPGATLLARVSIGWTLAHRSVLVRVPGTVLAFFLATGLWLVMIVNAIPTAPPKPGRVKVMQANRLCPTLPAMRPIAMLPKTVVLTFVDLGPRLITVTHHDAIAGPYHRNGAAILDIHHAFRGSPATALDVVRRHGVGLVLICPGMSETTIYRSQAPQGFYSQLVRGRVPGWLTPVALPKNSPFRAWRVAGGR